MRTPTFSRSPWPPLPNVTDLVVTKIHVHAAGVAGPAVLQLNTLPRHAMARSMPSMQPYGHVVKAQLGEGACIRKRPCAHARIWQSVSAHAWQHR